MIKMRIAIIDPKNQDIGLKILFPQADYYIFTSEECTINARIVSYQYYKFTPRTDIDYITSANYDVLFIIYPTICFAQKDMSCGIITKLLHIKCFCAV